MPPTQQYHSGDKVVIMDGAHTGKQAVIVSATLIDDDHYAYAVDGVAKTLRIYMTEQLEPAPKRQPVTDPLSLRAANIFRGLEV